MIDRPDDNLLCGAGGYFFSVMVIYPALKDGAL